MTENDAPENRPVWMITASFFPRVGGSELQAQRLSVALHERGWRVQILTRRHHPDSPNGLAVRDNFNGVPVHRVFSWGPGKIGSLLFFLSALRCLWRHHRGRTIYHAHDLGAAALIAIATRHVLGGRCLAKIRAGRAAHQQQFSSALGRLRKAILVRGLDGWVAVSKQTERMLRDWGVPSRRVFYIPNSVNTGVYLPCVDANEKKRIRGRLRLPVEKLNVLYVGRLEHVKGVDILLRAWSKLPNKFRTQLHLCLVGDGSQRFALENLAGQLGIADTVVFAGHRERVLEFYWAADLFVLPSRSEGLSNALLEAMACGLNVIASDVGGADDLVQLGARLRLFPSEGVDALCRALGEAPSFAAEDESGVANRRAVLQVSLEKMVHRYSSLYQG